MDPERRYLGQPCQHCPCTTTTLVTSAQPCTGTPFVYRGRSRPIRSTHSGLVRERRTSRPSISGPHSARVTCPLVDGYPNSGPTSPPVEAATARGVSRTRLAQSHCLGTHAVSSYAVAAPSDSSCRPRSRLSRIGFRLSACGTPCSEPIPPLVHPPVRQQRTGRPHHAADIGFGFVLGRASSSVHPSANARGAL